MMIILFSLGKGKMLWHTKVRDYCLWIRNGHVLMKQEIVFLPCKQDGKFRVEAYDPYLFQCYCNQKGDDMDILL